MEQHFQIESKKDATCSKFCCSYNSWVTKVRSCFSYTERTSTLTVKDQLNLRDVVLVFKTLHHLTPPILTDKFKRNSEVDSRVFYRK